MKELIPQFNKARSVGVPLIAIPTPDPNSTILKIRTKASRYRTHEQEVKTSPIIKWDAVSGWEGVNEEGNIAIRETINSDVRQATTAINAQTLHASSLPEGTILFICNAHRHLKDNYLFTQALWNLRDEYSSTSRTAVLLGPTFEFPLELQQDILIIDEPLPNDKQLRSITERVIKSSAIIDLDEEETITKAVDALRGLAAFPAEQALSLSVTYGESIDIDALWDRKRKMISETPGLSVWTGKESFKSLGGLFQVKSYFTQLIKGRDPFRVVVFIDEGEKVFAGSTGPIQDSSGVSSGYLGTMLAYQQNTEADGVTFVGGPGTAKSAFAKALANEAGVLCISLDLNRMKKSLVGESEARLHQALKIITAVGGGRALFIMTCNRLPSIPPELRRRYPKIFYFDLPDETERRSIFKIYGDIYGVDPKDYESLISQPWTGDEIKRCFLESYRLNIPLQEASTYIVPVSKSSAEEIKSLREQADKKFLSTSYPGTYDISSAQTRIKSDRKITKSTLLN
jgi:hypothetical protein